MSTVGTDHEIGQRYREWRRMRRLDTDKDEFARYLHGRVDVWVRESNAGQHDDIGFAEWLAADLRSPAGIAALTGDETIRTALISYGIREYWENTDGAGLTADE